MSVFFMVASLAIAAIVVGTDVLGRAIAWIWPNDDEEVS